MRSVMVPSPLRIWKERRKHVTKGADRVCDILLCNLPEENSLANYSSYVYSDSGLSSRQVDVINCGIQKSFVYGLSPVFATTL